MRRIPRPRRLGVLVSACLGLLACEETASAVTFTVDSTQTTADVAINGTCDSDATADVDCTLRAAVEEANATAAGDAILFKKTSSAGGDPDDISFVAGAGNPTISVPPPTITQPLTVDAGDCSATASDPAKPCAVVTAGWLVDAAGEVLIEGLAFGGSGGATGIRVIEVQGTNPSIPDFQLYNSWFGIDTDGEDAGEIGTSLNGGVAAVRLEDVAGSRIGSGFPDDRNLFARQSVGLDIQGADDTQVLGNWFGVLPDGTFARAGEFDIANGDAIEITGDTAPNPDDEATGTIVGSSDPASGCDGGCNVIAGAGMATPPVGAAGIDLNGEPGDGEIPAAGAEILGNDIGESVMANTNAVTVGDADDVRIGGPAAGGADGNAISGNEVTSGAGAVDLLIQENVVEADAQSLAMILRGSGRVLDNRITGNSNLGAIRLQNTASPNFTIQGNAIGENADGSAAATGPVGIELLATANGNTIGGPGPGDGNLISDLSTTVTPGSINTIGIRIAGDDNDVLGNRIGVGSDGSARRLLAGVALVTDADDNTIGGLTASSENLISNTDNGNTSTIATAIKVTDAASDGNQILRNRGSANEGPFIDLGGDGAGNLVEPNGPNAGAQAPSITSATSTTATGTATPNSVIRLFAKADASVGEIEGFLGEITADGSGAWQVTFAPQPGGKLIAATATSGGSTSELSASIAVTPDPDPPPTTDTDPPETRIDRAPRDRIEVKRKAKVTYEFSSDEPGTTFLCTIDGKPQSPCSSPLKLQKLKKGKHRFEVVAVDPAGNVDSSPATDRFKVKRKKSRR